MDERDLTSAALLSCQRALLGAITPAICNVSMEWNGLKNLKLKVYYDTQPSEDEIEDMEIVTSEIVADLPFEWVEGVEIIVSTAPLKDLKYLRHLVYCRKE